MLEVKKAHIICLTPHCILKFEYTKNNFFQFSRKKNNVHDVQHFQKPRNDFLLSVNQILLLL